MPHVYKGKFNIITIKKANWLHEVTVSKVLATEPLDLSSIPQNSQF